MSSSMVNYSAVTDSNIGSMKPGRKRVLGDTWATNWEATSLGYDPVINSRHYVERFFFSRDLHGNSSGRKREH